MAAEEEYDKDIVSDLTPQEDSDNIDKTRDPITTNSTVLPVFIYQTGYTRPTTVHYLELFYPKKDRNDKRIFMCDRKKGI